MQLNHFTDLGLRVLMYLSTPAGEQPVTIAEIATRFEVSRSHLMKVVHFMALEGWVSTTRGKGGGLALAWPPTHYRLGHVVRTLEGRQELIDCGRPPCALRGRCGVKGMLDEALQTFFSTLDRHTLADALSGATGEAIVTLQRRPD